MFRHRVTVSAVDPIFANSARLPNMLRGTFEITFRRLVCHDISLDCRACPLLSACPYPAVFRPSPPAGAERLSRAQDLPRPFVLEPPVDAPARLRPGDELDVGLTLFGRANDLAPYFVVALRALADRGLGPTRGRLRIGRVVGQTPDGEHGVFDAGTAAVRPVLDGLRLPHLCQPNDERARRVRIRFVTPTTLKRDGRWVETPSFADVVCRIRDRLSSLAAFYGDGPVEMDFAGVGGAASAVRTVECRTRWERRTRRSNRTGAVHETSGFVGEAVYAGEVGPWMPLLRLGEAVHVGKYAVWGNGRVEVEAA
ncbi:MAG: CRISPR system precrRNA processing endoribonuclease RAMP protein Cas6 [bacterium]|nr:CRISPR system precrRNA processing endoribonuclease RAMP protein Cas6 [bacterium]